MSQKVLLVEDDNMLNDAFTILLEQEGFEVVSAFDGKEALEKLGSYRPDIILLDLLMPVMDGKQFLKVYENKSHIPIIVFSNLDDKASVEEVMDLGASRYMLKAWASPKELVTVIKNTILANV